MEVRETINNMKNLENILPLKTISQNPKKNKTSINMTVSNDLLIKYLSTIKKSEKIISFIILNLKRVSSLLSFIKMKEKGNSYIISINSKKAINDSSLLSIRRRGKIGDSFDSGLESNCKENIEEDVVISNKLVNDLFKYISDHIKLVNVYMNTQFLKYGTDIKDKFYVILKGNANVYSANIKYSYLSEEEMLLYLIHLRKNEEYDLLQMSYYENYERFLEYKTKYIHKIRTIREINIEKIKNKIDNNENRFVIEREEYKDKKIIKFGLFANNPHQKKIVFNESSYEFKYIFDCWMINVGFLIHSEMIILENYFNLILKNKKINSQECIDETIYNFHSNLGDNSDLCKVISDFNISLLDMKEKSFCKYLDYFLFKFIKNSNFDINSSFYLNIPNSYKKIIFSEYLLIKYSLLFPNDEYNDSNYSLFIDYYEYIQSFTKFDFNFGLQKEKEKEKEKEMDKEKDVFINRNLNKQFLRKTSNFTNDLKFNKSSLIIKSEKIEIESTKNMKNYNERLLKQYYDSYINEVDFSMKNLFMNDSNFLLINKNISNKNLKSNIIDSNINLYSLLNMFTKKNIPKSTNLLNEINKYKIFKYQYITTKSNNDRIGYFGDRIINNLSKSEFLIIFTEDSLLAEINKKEYFEYFYSLSKKLNNNDIKSIIKSYVFSVLSVDVLKKKFINLFSIENIYKNTLLQEKIYIIKTGLVKVIYKGRLIDIINIEKEKEKTLNLLKDSNLNLNKEYNIIQLNNEERYSEIDDNDIERNILYKKYETNEFYRELNKEFEVTIFQIQCNYSFIVKLDILLSTNRKLNIKFLNTCNSEAYCMELKDFFSICSIEYEIFNKYKDYKKNLYENIIENLMNIKSNRLNNIKYKYSEYKYDFQKRLNKSNSSGLFIKNNKSTLGNSLSYVNFSLSNNRNIVNEFINNNSNRITNLNTNTDINIIINYNEFKTPKTINNLKLSFTKSKNNSNINNIHIHDRLNIEENYLKKEYKSNSDKKSVFNFWNSKYFEVFGNESQYNPNHNIELSNNELINKYKVFVRNYSKLKKSKAEKKISLYKLIDKIKHSPIKNKSIITKNTKIRNSFLNDI